MTKAGQAGAAFAFLALLAGCQTDQQGAAAPPPDARAIILANKGRLWKDPDSIKNAQITEPYPAALGGWHVCVRLNAKNSYGAYAGESDEVIELYPDGTTRSFGGPAPYCSKFSFSPFPELNGDYRAPTPPAPRGKPKA